MKQQLFGLTEERLAQLICHGADVTGCEGQQWGIMAQGMRLYLELAHGIVSQLNALGHPECLTTELRGRNELCRIEGDEIIVVVQMEMDKDYVSYDTVVHCAQPDMRPVMAKAIEPLVRAFGKKHRDLMLAYVASVKDGRHEIRDGQWRMRRRGEE